MLQCGKLSTREKGSREGGHGGMSCNRKETGNVSDQMPLRTVTNKVTERNRR